MYQSRLNANMPLEKVCFRMQPSTVAYIRAAARESGLSQSAVLNAIILDFALRQVEPGTVERSFKLKRAAAYAAALVAHLPKSSVAHLLGFCQDHVPENL